MLSSSSLLLILLIISIIITLLLLLLLLLLLYYYYYIIIIIIIIIYNLMLSVFKYPVRQNQIREKIQFTGIMIIVTSPVVYLLKIHLFT